MWGGRFDKGPASVMEDITPSIDFDKRLAAQDLAGSRAHARMLAATGIVSEADCTAILDGLDAIGAEILQGKFVFRRELEDIHLNIEARLKEIAGEAAGRLHTARSRNDQVATDFRLWVREACGNAQDLIAEFQRSLLTQAASHAETIMPGFTHMQPAQPVTFGHHCLAYVEMAARDRSRFTDASARMNESPLGAADGRTAERDRETETGEGQGGHECRGQRLAGCLAEAGPFAALAPPRPSTFPPTGGREGRRREGVVVTQGRGPTRGRLFLGGERRVAPARW